VERSIYLWIARPPKIRSWNKDLGIAGFIKLDSLPPYFRDRVTIYVAWNEPAPIVPWESDEEAQLRLLEEDVFEQSDIASQVIAHAGRKRAPPPPQHPPPMEEVITVASSVAGATSDSGNLWDLLDSRETKCTRFRDPASLFPSAAPTDSVLSRRSAASDAAHAPLNHRPPRAPTPITMQYTPARGRVRKGHLPFGRSPAGPAISDAFNPFPPAEVAASIPRYSSMHSPDKRSTLVSGIRDSRTDVHRSLKALLEPQTSGTSSTQWTFTDVHLGSQSARAHAKLSCLLAIHDIQWEGFINGNH
jgi:hypothetical protein